LRSWSRPTRSSGTATAPSAPRASRFRVRRRQQSDSLLSALKNAGYDAQAHAPPPPVIDNSLPKFMERGGKDGAAPRIGGLNAPGGTPRWIKSKRRGRWRDRAKNALAWIATLVVVGLIIWGAAVALTDGALFAPPPAPASAP